MLRGVWLVPAAFLVGCTGLMHGPPIELADVAAPDPPKAVQAPPPVPLPASPVLPRGTFRAWEVARQAEDGTMTEGRWITIRTTAPPVQQVEPEKLMPRAPHRAPSPKGSKDAPRGTPPPPPGPPPLPQGVPEHLSGIPGMQQVIEQLQRTRQAPPAVGGP